VARPRLSWARSADGARKYHNQTIHDPFCEAQRFLNLRLQQRDNGRVSRAAVLSLNQLLDQWLSLQSRLESGRERCGNTKSDHGAVSGSRARLRLCGEHQPGTGRIGMAGRVSESPHSSLGSLQFLRGRSFPQIFQTPVGKSATRPTPPISQNQTMTSPTVFLGHVSSGTLCLSYSFDYFYPSNSPRQCQLSC
jgi:hypothetical protein